MAALGAGDLSPPTRSSASDGVVDAFRPGWVLSLVPAAGEGGGSFVASVPVRRERAVGPAGDPERAVAEAARRARREIRRYCVANGLNRLGTLTYAGEGCHDERQLRVEVGEFFRALRRLLGGDPLAYLWVPEWHKSGHGLHVHFAVGRFVKRSLIEAAWGRGFVHITLLSDLPVGSGRMAEARRAAGYLAKYVGKDFAEAGRTSGLHRYEIAQGFRPVVERVWAPTFEGLLDAASVRMGARPARVWQSSEVEDWQGPPAVWVAWD